MWRSAFSQSGASVQASQANHQYSFIGLPKPIVTSVSAVIGPLKTQFQDH